MRIFIRSQKLQQLREKAGGGFESAEVMVIMEGFAYSSERGDGSISLELMVPDPEERKQWNEITVRVVGDYLVTDENRAQAVDEIIRQLKGDSTDEVEIKALRDYANSQLDESEPFGMYDLSASVAAFSDGYARVVRRGGDQEWQAKGMKRSERKA